jgi:hypothetical protein
MSCRSVKWKVGRPTDRTCGSRDAISGLSPDEELVCDTNLAHGASWRSRYFVWWLDKGSDESELILVRWSDISTFAKLYTIQDLLAIFFGIITTKLAFGRVADATSTGRRGSILL